MIEEKISLHGKYQFEIKQYFRFSSGQKDNSFYVKTYFFIPNNLNINADSYNKKDFYSDLNTYIRLKTPSVYLKDLAASSDIYDKLKTTMESVKDRNGQGSISAYEDEIKIFCLILKRSLRLQLLSIDNSKSLKDASFLTREYVKNIYLVLKKFREHEKILAGCDGEVMTLYQFADEYISLKVESHSFKLLEVLKNKKGLKNYKAQLLKLIKEENAYRAGRAYPSIPSADSNNAKFIFRQGVLKKYLSSVLFLETRIERSGRFVEQLLYSLSAGLAMIFATTVAFIGQNQYGSLTMPFFIALVISYMFKDRLKDLLRTYFSRGITKRLYDRKKHIYRSFKNKIGICRESFNFIKETKVPQEILDMRKRDRFTDIDNSLVGEEVILYRKYVKLNTKRFKTIKDKYKTEGIIDIVRFNVDKFLRYMDDPGKKIFIANGNDYQVINGDRVYHMNIITHNTVNGIDHYNKFRVIFNRNGIQKITEVLP